MEQTGNGHRRVLYRIELPERPGAGRAAGPAALSALMMTVVADDSTHRGGGAVEIEIDGRPATAYLARVRITEDLSGTADPLASLVRAVSRAGSLTAEEVPQAPSLLTRALAATGEAEEDGAAWATWAALAATRRRASHYRHHQAYDNGWFGRVLETLHAESARAGLRAGVAGTTDDPELFARLANDPDVTVRTSVAQRLLDKPPANVSAAELLEALLADPEPDIRAAIATETSRLDLLARLADDREERVRDAVLRRSLDLLLTNPIPWSVTEDPWVCGAFDDYGLDESPLERAVAAVTEWAAEQYGAALLVLRRAIPRRALESAIDVLAGLAYPNTHARALFSRHPGVPLAEPDRELLRKVADRLLDDDATMHHVRRRIERAG